ncbi:hypothetical protein Tco_0357791 [Tanacetum coccineum]
MLFRDRRAHAYTRHLMETEARLSREAWRRSMDVSDLTRGELMSLRTTVLGQMSEIRELQPRTQGSSSHYLVLQNTRIHAKRMSSLLAHVTTKEVEDKSEKKRLEDVPIV